MSLRSIFKSILGINEQHRYFNVGGFSVTRKELMEDLQFAMKLNTSLMKYCKGQSEEFVPITDKPYVFNPSLPKLLAYYLPQFHAIPLNDKNFGKGFTEWTNVARSVPLFEGHHQPQIPYDVGFYDLSNVDVMYRQVELAKMYGISGFCFYYYWFSGQPILEKPLHNWLNHKDLDLEYCFFWANESWMNTWWGGQNEMLIEQKYLPGEEQSFVKDILPFFEDPRYIKINNRPLLIVYKPWDLARERFIEYFNCVRQGVQKAGFDDLYLVYVDNFSNSVEQWGFDAAVEFFPMGISNKSKTHVNRKVLADSNLQVWSLDHFLKNKDYLYPSNHKVFKSIYATWDNSARTAFKKAHLYEGVTPETFTIWLNDIIKYTKENNSDQEQYIFINAWNEWAEGAHLEPDVRYGYKWLQVIKNALENYKDE